MSKSLNPHGLVERELLHPDGDYCDRCLTYDERKARDESLKSITTQDQ